MQLWSVVEGGSTKQRAHEISLALSRVHNSKNLGRFGGKKILSSRTKMDFHGSVAMLSWLF